MHGHISKRAKMHIKPTGGVNKYGKHVIKQGLMGVGCNHTTTNSLRASNVAKPRTRETNTSIKHISKQA